jgi:predicted unusual protein kinase regulating ubiquinone biosynthesis (AarF/ABC1/UbiB family)
VFDNVKRFRRSARVARTGARIYFGYKRTQRKVRKMDDPEARRAAWHARHEQFGELLYKTAVDLKGMYIKSGQFAGTRTDIIPEPYTRFLSRLQDAVPPRPVETIKRTITEELGKPAEELFTTFDEVPLAAASLAQVHRATLSDGREVVVKVQYPEVAQLVKLDVRNLRSLVRIVAWREPDFDFRAIVNELGTQVPLELDFVREAEMTRRVRANLAHLQGVELPVVVDGMVSKKVLVTEFIPGARLLDRELRSEYAPDAVALAQRIADAYGHQIMVDGLFQADPHPGNILVLPGGRVALLDFGLTKELPDRARLGFAKLVLASAERNPEAIMEAFADLGVRTKSDEPESLLLMMRMLFEPRPIGGGIREARAQRQTMRANPVEAIPGDLVLLGRVIGLLRGVCASLGSPLSPMQMLKPHAEQALATHAKQAS